MATIKNMTMFDLLDYNNINLDILTETVSSIIQIFILISLTQSFTEYILFNGKSIVKN